MDDLDARLLSELARDARGDDTHGYRSEFISLVALAQSIDPSDRVAAR